MQQEAWNNQSAVKFGNWDWAYCDCGNFQPVIKNSKDTSCGDCGKILIVHKHQDQTFRKCLDNAKWPRIIPEDFTKGDK